MMTLPELLGDYWFLILAYVFYYPMLMSLIWMMGAIVFYFRYERGWRQVHLPPPLNTLPKVAVLVPCYNEIDNAEVTLSAIMQSEYPNYEVLAINDGSTDGTGELLNTLAAGWPRLRVIHQAKNQGKAVGLNTAALLTDADILVGIDGDALLDPWALHWLVRHFDETKVGAVTGNPRIRNRSRLLGRLQVGEFSSIIGLIKRAQRSVGLIFTVSGVIAAFRREALREVGFWSPEKLTEDVDISWKLQLAQWEVRFEPRALSWILMPETVRGLWRQRLRWSTGGTQVLMAYGNALFSLRQIRLWPMFIEYVMSIIWALLMAALVLYRLADLVLFPISLGSVPILLFGWAGMLIGTICLLQSSLSITLDRPYDQGLPRMLFWLIWYPLVYWLLSAASAVVGLFNAVLRKSGERATWKSPDRGSSSKKPT